MKHIMNMIIAGLFALFATVSLGDVSVMASRAYVDKRTDVHSITNNGEEIGCSVGIHTNIILATTNVVATAAKVLNDRIDSLSSRGRYLSLWSCTNGLPYTDPTTSPYNYRTGDYFIVGDVSYSSAVTNFCPAGTNYTSGVSSSVVETNAVAVNDTYYYDGERWSLLTSQKDVEFRIISGSPYDNASLKDALDAKASFADATNAAVAVSADKRDKTDLAVYARSYQPWTIDGFGELTYEDGDWSNPECTLSYSESTHVWTLTFAAWEIFVSPTTDESALNITLTNASGRDKITATRPSVYSDPTATSDTLALTSALTAHSTNATAHSALFAAKADRLTAIYDFNCGTNFTRRLYEVLTNVIATLGGTVTNTPAFN